jgi:hypothetical protein
MHRELLSMMAVKRHMRRRREEEEDDEESATYRCISVLREKAIDNPTDGSSEMR